MFVDKKIIMKIPVLSYFAGGGFLDLGFELEGYNIIWSNEISLEISKIYNSGMTSTLKKKKQITSNEPIESIDANMLKCTLCKRLDSKIWGIIGGPPCPDFSIGGKNKGKDGERGKLHHSGCAHRAGICRRSYPRCNSDS